MFKKYFTYKFAAENWRNFVVNQVLNILVNAVSSVFTVSICILLIWFLVSVHQFRI